MIDIHNITCSSELHDSCGVVFKHEGRIFRALYPRGKQIFDRLAENGSMDRLVSLGLVKMGRTDLAMPGYEAVIEADTISPIIAPIKWSTGMLCEAGQVLCALSQELLKHRLLLWDLKHFSNMAFCSKRGPVFLDLGAIHSVEELEHNVFNISNGSLLDQIAHSFYVPLWLTLGRPGRFRSVRRFVNYRRRGPEAFDLPAAVLRRMSFRWMAVPGLWRGAKLLKAGRYEQFFSLVAHKLRTWSATLSAQTKQRPEWNDWKAAAGAEYSGLVGLVQRSVGTLSDKICFDLSRDKGYGLTVAREAHCATYLFTSKEGEADALFAWRQKMKTPALPVVCNIWERSLKPAFALKGGADVVFILPDVFEAARDAQVPLDFIGRVLSMLTTHVAIVGMSRQTESTFPGFVSPPAGPGDAPEFARKTIGKYFREQELIEPFGSYGNSMLVVFKK